MMPVQEREIRHGIKVSGMLSKPGFPTFREFVDGWVPKEIMDFLWKVGGGKQTAEATATLELMHMILIVMKAGDASFEISPDLITALRDTEIPKTPVSELRLPFEAVMIDIPAGTFAAPGNGVTRLYLCRIDSDGRFRVVFNTTDDNTSYASCLVDPGSMTVEEAVLATEEEIKHIPEDVRRELENGTEYKDYFSSDVFRFAVNTALYLTSDEADIVEDKSAARALHAKLQGERKARKREILLLRKREAARQSKRFIVGAKFRLSQEYRADLTEMGKKWALKHKCRTMGHFKQQAHGPKMELRKRIWIMPYWRGLGMAEMLSKGYVVR